ncbi:hypothetical protein [Pseudomonas helleri]|uniref:hypothetical protein n=1 Tax=Pseudomonas helleri TaxID=1608996 RepID=UPI003FD48521
MSDIESLQAYAGQLAEAAAQATASAEKQHEYVNGGAAADVLTESGLVPTLAKQAVQGQAKVTASLAEVASQMAGAMTYANTALGLAGTNNGGYFSVPSPESVEYLILYQNVAGAAVETARYPSAKAVEQLATFVESILDADTSSDDYACVFADTPNPGVYSRIALAITKAGKVDLGVHKDVGALLTQLLAPGLLSENADFERSGYLFAILDALNRIGVGLTTSGDFIVKGRSVDGRLTALETSPPPSADYEKWINGLSTVACFGDSLTAGGYPDILSGMLGRPVHTGAVGGQNSQQIATRQGGYVNLLTVTGNTIPASGAVNITASTQAPISSQGGGPIIGTLAGVAGSLSATFDGSGNRTAYLFTRTTAGASKIIDPATPFIPSENDHPFKITVFWYGRNNFWTGRTDFDNAKAEVKAALAASIAHLKPLNKKFIVMSVLNDNKPAEWLGTEKYNAITSLNEELKALYPRQFIDIRRALVRSYNPALPQDVIDFGHDVTPTSLLSDTLHHNFAGKTVVAQTVFNFIQQQGW